MAKPVRLWLGFMIVMATGGVAAQQTVGLFLNDDAAYDGYTLFAPMNNGTTYLINNDGWVVNSWTSAYSPGLAMRLLPDGRLLRNATVMPPPFTFFAAAGYGGRTEIFDWDGTLLWAYDIRDNSRMSHHDVLALPNGNVLIMYWEVKSAQEAIDAGRDPAKLADPNLWPEVIVEVEPVGATGGNVVWEWHAWDHIIQDFDPGKPNFGVVADHPELIDLNYDTAIGDQDWLHFNGMDYNPDTDQIVISVRQFSEFWVIDHSTTTAEAAGHSGGTYGKGGDLLYRWGNPRTYRRGTAADRVLEFQHDAQWIDPGLPGAGNIIVFNNGAEGRNYSSADELVPAEDGNGNYDDPGTNAFGPAALTWTYQANPPHDFFAAIISGVHRQPNGNTLITDGPKGSMFEVAPDGTELWRYVCPVDGSGPMTQGASPGNQGPRQTNAVFKARRYPPDYAAFTGRTLTPTAPIEDFTPPKPIAAGSLSASRVAADRIEVRFDADSCPADGYSLLYGSLAAVQTLLVDGAECGLSVSGTHLWQDVPSGDLFFIVVGVDGLGVYESSWGVATGDLERGSSRASGLCGVTTKSVAETCP